MKKETIQNHEVSMEQGISLQTLVDGLHNLEEVYGAVETDCGYTIIIDKRLGGLYYDLWNNERLILCDGEVAELIAVNEDTYYYKVEDLEFELSQREFDLAVFS